MPSMGAVPSLATRTVPNSLRMGASREGSVLKKSIFGRAPSLAGSRNRQESRLALRLCREPAGRGWRLGEYALPELPGVAD
jgi:hypothetical protein